MVSGRTVMLRGERDGKDRRFLWAYVDVDGNLHIDGQDLGPGTAFVSDDGEYEWFSVIAASDVRRVGDLLDGSEQEYILDLLERRWTGERSYELERRLRESDIRVERSVYG